MPKLGVDVSPRPHAHRRACLVMHWFLKFSGKPDLFTIILKITQNFTSVSYIPFLINLYYYCVYINIHQYYFCKLPRIFILMVNSNYVSTKTGAAELEGKISG